MLPDGLILCQLDCPTMRFRDVSDGPTAKRVLQYGLTLISGDDPIQLLDRLISLIPFCYDRILIEVHPNERSCDGILPAIRFPRSQLKLLKVVDSSLKYWIHLASSSTWNNHVQVGLILGDH